MAVVTITGYKCERCEHEWVPINRPQKCDLLLIANLRLVFNCPNKISGLMLLM